nr:MAG TPA: hypothetical protein [Caudoviricetes sp.]DAS46198.1 MAG TPA: hypothetical protein [Caudoviricetes sp.]
MVTFEKKGNRKKLVFTRVSGHKLPIPKVTTHTCMYIYKNIFS